MAGYLIRRLLLLPVTLFFIVMINFVIINLSPGDPATVVEISDSGDATGQENQASDTLSEDKFLRFREHFGLTLPILFNNWSSITYNQLYQRLENILHYKQGKQDEVNWDFKTYHEQRVLTGDQSRFVMPLLLKIFEDENLTLSMRQLASRFFIRGATKQGKVGPALSREEKKANRKIAEDNDWLSRNTLLETDSDEEIKAKVLHLKQWYQDNKLTYKLEPKGMDQTLILLFETRFCRYLSKVLTLDFGTIKNDDNKRVIDEVVKRFKYSFTLAILPMLITFCLCMLFGVYMAANQNTYKDLGLNILFLVLYAAPVFVVGPFLIEKVALNNTFLFTDTPIPIGGFNSSEEEYKTMTSMERLIDIAKHLVLPLCTIMYGGLAAQTRIARTAVLEVLRQNYVRTAQAKGLSRLYILFKHVGRNASITIVTSVAGSLGVIIGGSLIVETIFGINGFGKFFYEAILNYDYNVIMFSVIIGSFLTLLGYLVADICYTILDPRVTLD